MSAPDPSTEALIADVREGLGILSRLTHTIMDGERSLRANESFAALSARLSQAEEALRVADDLLRRLSEWDVLNLPRESMSDGPYWQGEIRIARAALAASSAGETPDG